MRETYRQRNRDRQRHMDSEKQRQRKRHRLIEKQRHRETGETQQEWPSPSEIHRQTDHQPDSYTHRELIKTQWLTIEYICSSVY